MELAQRHCQKVNLHQKAINEGAIKSFLSRRHDKGHAQNMSDDVKPGKGAALTKLLERSSAWIKLADARIESIQTNPSHENHHANYYCFPTDLPAHLLNDGPDLPNHPGCDNGFDEVNPVKRCRAQVPLERG